VRAWSDRPFGPVTPLPEVAAPGARIAGENGQSTMVYESAAHPGWLVKRYKPGFPEEPAEVLDRLIALPDSMKPHERAVVDTATCWPVSRVESDGRTVGVVMAKAPAEFFVRVRTPFGASEPMPLSLDQLVQTDREFYEARDMPVPDRRERVRVARNMLRVGALLERRDVVYGDWSYANLFWARESGRVFFIDMDGCGLTSRSWVECNSWDDPAVRQGERLTVHTDRYKIAVAVLRALTGVRGQDPHPALDALGGRLRTGPFGAALKCALDDPPELRPSSGELLELLESELDDRPEPSSVPPAREPRPVPEPVREHVRAPVPAPVHAPVRPAGRPVTRPRIEDDPFERDAAGPADGGLDRYVMPLIITCLGVLALLTLAGLASALF
jgi:hypothetical protein